MESILAIKSVVKREFFKQNQNPFIFYNKQDDNFYLAYYNGVERSKDSTKTCGK